MCFCGWCRSVACRQSDGDWPRYRRIRPCDQNSIRSNEHLLHNRGRRYVVVTSDDIFEGSFKRAIGNDSFNYDFITRFYNIFLDSSDDVAEMFSHTNMSVQKTMLHDSLQMMVEFYRSGEANDNMRRVAEVHSRAQHDIPSNLYDVWLDSLLQALSEFDPEFGPRVAEAWREVLGPGIEYMRGMYNAG